MLLEEYDPGPYETFDEDQANQYIHEGVIEFPDRVLEVTLIIQQSSLNSV
jgi:hypothetical protein